MIGRTDIGAEVQHRSYEIVDFEFRDDSNSSTGYRFEGVASVVDKPYTVRDQFGEFQETIKRGAFNKTLKDGKADVALFVNHNAKAPPLATRAAGTLELDAKPDLHVTADLDPERPDVQVVRSAVRRGEMRQMSIGFNVPKARDEWNDDFTERMISEVGLVETSIVWRGSKTESAMEMVPASPLTSSSSSSAASSGFKEAPDTISDVTPLWRTPASATSSPRDPITPSLNRSMT